jgi:hypothetical protein
MAERVTTDDLEMAAQWLMYYDGADDDPNGPACARVAAWLLAEAARREEDQTVRKLVKQTGAAPSRVRRILRKKAGERQ